MRVCPECFQLYGPDRDECERDGAKLVHYTKFLIGLQLGPYVIRSLASEGGMGVVYAAEHPALGRRVAIKVLRPELSLRDDIVERFIQEARAVNTIGHDNIVNIYDFGKTPFGSFYIVMEYLDGLTVRELLDETGPQPLEGIRFIIHEVATALAAAHAKGFIHRDVKPANIMVCQRAGLEYVKLLDFGIAKLLTSSDETTNAGIALGTPQYMSPEQLENGVADPRTDTYALGVVAYELLTGKVPYPGTSQAAVRHAQTTYRPQAPSQCRRDIRLATSIDQFVFKTIALRPSDRYQRMEDLLESFQAAHEDTMAQQSAGPGVSTRRTGSPRWPRPLLLAAGALLLCLAAVGGFLLHARKDSSAPETSGAAASGVTSAATTARGAGAPIPANPPQDPMEPSQEPMEIVRQSLSNPSRAARRAVVEKIGKVRPERLRKPLIRALADEDSIVRRLAAQALGQMRSQTAATIRALRAALPRQLSFSAIAFAEALARLGDEVGILRLRRELVLARRRGPRAVRFALEALVQFDPSAAQRLSRFAHRVQWADSPETKARLLRKMAQAGARAARHQLQQAAQEQSGEPARLQASVALSEIDRAAALPSLQRLSKSATGTIRARAAATLLAQGDVRVAESLLEFLDSEESSARVVSALGLGRARVQRAWPAELEARAQRTLLRALRDENDDVKSAAAVALLAF